MYNQRTLTSPSDSATVERVIGASAMAQYNLGDLVGIELWTPEVALFAQTICEALGIGPRLPPDPEPQQWTMLRVERAAAKLPGKENGR